MTRIIAHRGSKGTHPENTLAAFKEAIRVGADGIELDIHLTKDKQLVVIHDETVDRTTDGVGEINQLTLKEIKSLMLVVGLTIIQSSKRFQHLMRY
ncbi:glycerophosphodiester phosphodiesterase family protein [Enterococcus rivorum]|uniref:glycerophosphodiester phosphodiesterase family protein n=1 Tax=Enterococcus rivorum TaxID=762845 RepID=UPI00363B3A83